MTKLKTKRELFDHYFTQEHLNKSLVLDDRGMLHYHWANDPVMLNHYKQDHQRDDGFIKRYEQLKQYCSELEKVPIWLSSQRGTLPSSLRHLYECYLDPRMRQAWQQMDDVMVSFQDSLGPYTSIKNLNWYREDVYSAFVFRKIFETWIPERQFRLGVNIELSMHRERNPFSKKSAYLHQVSGEGLVIKLLTQDSLLFTSAAGDGDFCFHISDRKKKRQGRRKGRQTESFTIEAWQDALTDFILDEQYVTNALKKEHQAQRDYTYIFIPYHHIRAHNFNKQNILDLLWDTQSQIHKDVA